MSGLQINEEGFLGKKTAPETTQAEPPVSAQEPAAQPSPAVPEALQAALDTARLFAEDLRGATERAKAMQGQLERATQQAKATQPSAGATVANALLWTGTALAVGWLANKLLQALEEPLYPPLHRRERGAEEARTEPAQPAGVTP